MNHLRGLVFPALLVVLFVGSSFGNTVTMNFNSVGGASIGGEDVYPYYFYVNGSNVLTPLICDTYSNQITFGQMWTANTDILPPSGTGLWNSVPSQTGFSQSQNYEAAGIIFYEILTNNLLALHGNLANGNLAIWALFDGGRQNSGWTSADQTIIDNALASTGLYDSEFYSQFTLYTPTNANASLMQGTGMGPQEFIGFSPTPVPELPTFPMMGSGLAMMVGLLRGKIWGRRVA